MFAETLKALRKEKGMTQRQLAEKLFIDCSSVTKWETGKANPDFEKQQKLAELFNVSIDFLLGRTDTSDLLYITAKNKVLLDEFKELDEDMQKQLLNIAHYNKFSLPSLSEDSVKLILYEDCISKAICEELSKNYNLDKSASNEPNIIIPYDIISAIKDGNYKFSEFTLEQLCVYVGAHKKDILIKSYERANKRERAMLLEMAHLAPLIQSFGEKLTPILQPVESLKKIAAPPVTPPVFDVEPED